MTPRAVADVLHHWIICDEFVQVSQPMRPLCSTNITCLLQLTPPSHGSSVLRLLMIRLSLTSATLTISISNSVFSVRCRFARSSLS